MLPEHICLATHTHTHTQRRSQPLIADISSNERQHFQIAHVWGPRRSNTDRASQGGGTGGPTPVFLRPEIAELRPVRLALRPALLPTRFLPHQPDAFRQTLQHFAHLQPYVCDIVAHAQLFPD